MLCYAIESVTNCMHKYLPKAYRISPLFNIMVIIRQFDY